MGKVLILIGHFLAGAIALYVGLALVIISIVINESPAYLIFGSIIFIAGVAFILSGIYKTTITIINKRRVTHQNKASKIVATTYSLDNAFLIHQESPDTFHLPTREEITALKVKNIPR